MAGRGMRLAAAAIAASGLALAVALGGAAAASASEVVDSWSGFTDPQKIVLSADGATAYVANSGVGVPDTISVVRTANGTITDSIPLADGPDF